MINEIGVPIVLVGNYKALSVLSGDFSQIRRGTGQGDLIWDLMEKDEQWELFVESLWRFQYTKKKCRPDDIEKPTKKSNRINEQEQKRSSCLSDILYEETQGITDFAVKVYMFAQERAIDSGKEVVTGNIIRSVAKDKLLIAREVLQALKTKDIRVLERYEDLYYKAFKSYLHQQPEPVQFDGKINYSPVIKEVITDSDSTGLTEPKAVTGSDEEIIPEAKVSGSDLPSAERQVLTRPPSPRKRLKVTPAQDKGELPRIVASLGTKDGVAAYEALKEAGHIRAASEFLECE